jgi:Fuc2NAc and GlcNAc transferase
LISNLLILMLTLLLAGWLLVAAVRKLALHWGVVDLPNERSSHSRPTARGGGIAIAVVTLSAVLIGWASQRLSNSVALAWLVGGGLIAGIGLLDDLRGLSALVRAAVHVLAAVVLLTALGLPAGLVPASWPVGLWVASWVAAVVLIVWSVNLFNFMDGIDGLAAAQCVFVAAAAALLLGWSQGLDDSVLPVLAMAAATAGFLVWNVPPARIFMGDVGSGFIGFGLIAGALATSGHGLVSFWTWLTLNALFVADATVTVLVRFLRGQRVYEAHRLHVYQKLVRRWSSHGQVTGAYTGINLVWCLPWAVATIKSPVHAPLFAASALLPLCLAAIFVGAGQPDS